ncbi:hypothetical protein PybrP1_006184 [[Pythium] brassicae (nom. inval.)]|nr:hypothetical protein PybrP1_006184 [[Pythium] brassicae (nom. inval.)]
MEGMLNYFIPEDGDSSDHLNVVPLPRVDQLRLQHIKKARRTELIFPLPGQFHFRFKTPFEGTFVWLDLVNDADVVPDFNGLVISKIARMQRENTTRPADHVDVKTPPAKEPDLIQTSPEPTPAKREESAPVPKVFNDDLVGLDVAQLADPVPTTAAPGPSASASPAPTPQPAPQDPFNLFMGSTASSPMRPMGNPMSAPRGPPVSSPGAFGGNPGAFNAMGGGAPRPGVGMGISQMHLGMPPHQQQQQQQQNSFQGLQWGGMGGNPPQQGQQQQRNPMQQNPNNRQW